MIDWKAVVAGVIATSIIGLVNQLVFILIASWIGSAGLTLAALATYKEQLWLGAALLIHCITMTLGGLVTAFFCERGFVSNAALVGGLATGVSLASSLGAGGLTWMSLVLFLLGIGFGALGGWLRGRRIEPPAPTA